MENQTGWLEGFLFCVSFGVGRLAEALREGGSDTLSLLTGQRPILQLIFMGEPDLFGRLKSSEHGFQQRASPFVGLGLRDLGESDHD